MSRPEGPGGSRGRGDPAGAEGAKDGAGDGRGDGRADGPGTGAGDLAAAALARARAAARERGEVPSRQPGRGAGLGATPDGRWGAWARRPVGPGGSGAGPDARDPQTLAASVGRLVDERGWDEQVAVGGVMGRWAQVVGAEVADHCRPVQFEEGVLVVAADSTAWATQVRLLTSTLLRRLDEEVGAGVVRQLSVRGPASRSWRSGTLRARDGRGPRDTYG